MLIATLLFVAVTALSIALHVRSGKADRSRGPTCARCSAPLASGDRVCARCGLPQQAIELVQSAEIAIEPADGDAEGALRALVRSDQCVGCGACVAACPEEGALVLRGKLAAVDPARCKGHGECASACPVGAITMARGGAENRVRVPWVDTSFQTNVPGLYIVGELGGRGLIKNAVNEGKIAVEHVRRSLDRSHARTLSSEYDLVIVGSGPAGLSAALEAQRAQLRYVVLEQGTLADTIRKYPRHKLLLAEPMGIPLYGDLWIADGSKETLLAIWESVIERARLEVRVGQRVDRIERNGARFSVHTTSGADYQARRVVLAMGRRGTPRTLGVAGEELAKVVYDIVEMEDFAGRRVLVVGGGDSAVESVIGLARQLATSVTLSYRGDSFSRIKGRNRQKLEAAVAAGRVKLLLQSHVREIRDDVVVLEVNGAPRSYANDDVVIRIGGDAPITLLERIGVRFVTKALPPTPEVANAS
jgi:thioredoxin reductase/Pyruvate/2-oxoacid:ferredoxin oxidoreductase delta subunit